MRPGKYGAIVKPLSTLLVLLAAILLFFNKMAFSNLILARGDTFLYFYPYWHAAAEAVRAGRIPLWNPTIFMGTPLLANSQMGFFYPLNWPVWLLFDTPYALSASILLHVIIAASGAYLVGRKIARLGLAASLVTAVAFALGGYLTAQVEHVNQLQGLSWLPWMLLAAAQGRGADRRRWLRASFLLALLFALQLLAGHTQTAFISGVALIVWVAIEGLSDILSSEERPGKRKRVWHGVLAGILLVGMAGLVALLLAGLQILPTLELSRLSSRQGGLPLNEVLSFSLNPLLLTRALFPAYGQTLFSEYVAALPLTVLALAFVGAWQWRSRAGSLPALAWILTAFLFALGAYNPLNWLLGRLPGFDLFRVPARWLVLYAFGVALLAGIGWQTLLDFARASNASGHESGQLVARRKQAILRPLLVGLLAFMTLVLWSYLAGLLVDFIPTGAEAPFETPTLPTLTGWIIEIGLLLLFFWLFFRRSRAAPFGWKMRAALFGLVLIFLFVATRLLPYNNLTTPQAYYDLRPSTARLLVETGDPPRRLLSLSDIFFDLGEQPEIDTIYQDQLPAPAQYDYTVAAKQKEIISPNLPMLYDLASIDGFDGGILPLRAYTEQVKLLLPEGVVTTDGRLREYLDAVPDEAWLDLFNTGFLITDKVGDIWYGGVFFDRQHPYKLVEGEKVTVGYVPDYEATELRMLVSQQPGRVELVTAAGTRWELEPTRLEEGLYVAVLPEAAVLREIRVNACPNVAVCDLYALTLVDERDGTFQSLVPGDYRLIHSGDVKIYENLDVMPRAYAVTQWQWVQNEADMQRSMQMGGPDLRRQVILLAQGASLPNPSPRAADTESPVVSIDSYLPERVTIRVETMQDAMLVLSDAFYPGWLATLDGEPTPLYRADNLFRAVFVPAGKHEVQFMFRSQSFYYGVLITLASLAIVTIIMTGLQLSGRSKGV